MSYAKIRIQQARRLYKATFSLPQDRLAVPFEDYLLAIPPLLPAAGNPILYDLPVLVDRCMCVDSVCAAIGVSRRNPKVRFRNTNIGNHRLFHWIWTHDGSRLANLTPASCAECLGPNEFALGSTGGISFHIQYPHVARIRYLDLPGAKVIGNESRVACLGPWQEDGRVQLHRIGAKDRHRRCGSPTYCLPFAQD